MLRVGLTGGIGSGKSTATTRFASLGAVVVDGDVLARAVVEPGSPGLAAVVRRFGEAVVGADGALDRAALGAMVFSDTGALRDLEAITHPLIAERTTGLMAAAPTDAVVVHDMPLLVEKALGPAYHLVVVVDADEPTRLDRLVRLRGMDGADAGRRIAAQASDEQRRAAADVLLDNNGSRETLEAAVDALWEQRLLPYEANVRAGARSRRPDRLVLSPPDPGWADRGRRWAARVAHAAGDSAVRVDPIGSTAVPGLVAKDVVDLQVGVRSLAAADAPEFLDKMARAGFPRVPGTAEDHPKRGTQPWPKRFHGSADPATFAHVHVREIGSPGWRWALAFRDWLRSDAQARTEYAVMKLALATEIASTKDYAAAKEPWFDGVDGRLQEWVATTGWAPPD